MPRAFDLEPVLAMPLMAMLATVTDDGAPRNAPVWFLWEEGALWMPSTAGASTVRRLRHERRAAAEIVHFDNGAGVLLHVGMRGAAGVVAMQPDRFRRLLAKYLGPDEGAWNPWFIETIARIDDPDGRLIRLAPDSVFTNNVSHFRTGSALAWP
ncbi:pyridoxamine 5'-phosphate oxidase family protein [Citreimonas salinaria]|uniref:General stress protein 26 n=1 Tax=Citreimonas salinaria TaxID=321339 RepID=A0A1H3HA07_9RHOB|nr:pyridoxamine 5'-phosphate oxidase family protein [Citreimonas salinaria]SDY12423.1 General stress protein 26 [Citreimonas salinaria]